MPKKSPPASDWMVREGVGGGCKAGVRVGFTVERDSERGYDDVCEVFCCAAVTVLCVQGEIGVVSKLRYRRADESRRAAPHCSRPACP